jgi:hypothetical protein
MASRRQPIVPWLLNITVLNDDLRICPGNGATAIALLRRRATTFTLTICPFMGAWHPSALCARRMSTDYAAHGPCCFGQSPSHP